MSVKGSLHQEDAIGEPCQGVHFTIAVWELRIWRPLAHHCCTKANNERQAVEEHVNAVAEQAKRACSKTIEGLDKHETEIQAGR